MDLPLSIFRGFLLGFFLTMGIGFATVAQTAPSNSLDDLYNPPAGSILGLKDPNSNRDASSVGGAHIPQRNFISWDMGVAFRGIVGLSYGRVINPKFGLELGLGVTLFGDYFANYSHKILVGMSGVEPTFSNTTKTRFQFYNSYPERYIRPYFHIKGYYFLKEDHQEGSYLSLQYRFFQNSMVFGGNYASNDDYRPDRTRFVLDYHTLSCAIGFRNGDNTGHNLHDFCFGIGYRIARFPYVPVTKWNDDPTAPFKKERIFENALEIGPPTSEILTMGRFMVTMSYIWHVNF